MSAPRPLLMGRFIDELPDPDPVDPLLATGFAQLMQLRIERPEPRMRVRIVQGNEGDVPTNVVPLFGTRPLPRYI